MEVVDRHGWAEGMTIESYGKHVGLRTDRPGTLERLLDRLPPGWKRSDEVEVRRLYSLRVGGVRRRRRRYHVLYMNATRFERSQDFGWILDRLEADLQLYIADRAVNRIFVHAGVVAYEGRAILVPGRTHTGKTTLVEALLRLGATYYSDEYAVLSDAGRVYPFPRPLTVRSGDGSDDYERVDPRSLGAEVGAGSLPVGLVALTGYEPGVTFRPRRLHGGRAVLALLEHTVPARRRPKRSMRVLERVVRDAVVLKGRRGDAEAVAANLLARLG